MQTPKRSYKEQTLPLLNPVDMLTLGFSNADGGKHNVSFVEWQE